MKNLICSITFLLSFVTAFAQTNIDSLVNVLNEEQLTPLELFDITRRIRDFYRNSDMNKFIEYSYRGLEIAKKEKDEKNRYKMFDIAYEELGVGHTLKGSYDTALIYYDKALEYAIKINDRKIYRIYLHKGAIYYQQGDYSTTLELLLKALSLVQEIDDKIGETTVLNNIGNVYSMLGDYDHSIHYFEKAREIMEEHKLDLQRITIYETLGGVYYENKDYEKALEYRLLVKELCEIEGNKRYTIYNNIGLAYIYIDASEEYERAVEYAEEAVKLAEEFENPHAIYASLFVLSDAYFHSKRYKECEATAMRAWEMESTNVENTFKLASLLGITNMYLNNKENAMTFIEKLNDLKKDLNRKDYHANLMNMEVKYETEKKEMRIAALEQEQKLYMILGIAVVFAFLLGIGLLVYRHRLITQKKKLAEQQVVQLEQEQELIATRSALNAEKTEREIIARDLHDGVGAMLSVVKSNMDIMKPYSLIESTEANHLKKALDVLDKSIAELRRVAHHIMPATLIAKGLATALEDFCHSIPEVEFHITEPIHRFDTEKELVLYRCAYELVNNALRHANASCIDVHLSMDEQTVYLSVVDDGCGFDPQTTLMGMGINNMRTRLSVFNGQIDIFSEPGKGTEINIELRL